MLRIFQESSMRRQVSGSGLNLVGVEGDAMFAEVGTALFREQIKFSILQTLILIELAVTSSSPLIYALCGAGAAMLWSFCATLTGSNSIALVTLYPLILMVSTALLSVITLLKVYVQEEQSDLSLVFLGVAFTSDHLLLIGSIIPQIAKCNYANGATSGRNRQGEGETSGCLGSCCGGLVGMFVAVFLTSFGTIGGVVCLFHCWISYPIAWLMGKTGIVDRWLARWEEETVTKISRDIERSDAAGEKVVIDGNRREEVRNATFRSIFLFVTVIIVDLEFMSIAIAMAEVSGGVRLGGSSIET